MRHLLQLLIGLLACLALASALPDHFPRDKITTYRYYADVKTGNIEPKPFASEFAMTGFMHVKREDRDPSMGNAFYMVLNVTQGMRNGAIEHFEDIQDNLHALPEAARALHNPFIVIFDDNGKMKSLMVNKDEPGWSRNMKKSMASMLQLDMSSMNMQTPMATQAFLTKEDSIYGECAVSYNVHHMPGLGDEHFMVTKMMDPMSCTKFNKHTFNYKESTGCLVEPEEEMTTASRRVFHIENMGEHLLIRKVVAHGVINYFPFRAKSEAHYILANQSMEYESMMPMGDMALPEADMGEMETMNDAAFQRSESLYAVNAGVDPTHGRHVVNLEALITNIMKMLEEATDYMNENNLVMTSPEMKHGQTMNRIMAAMTRMDLPSLERIFNNFTEAASPREITMMNLFLNMVPYVGTNAAFLFTRNIIRKHKIEDNMAIMMMTKLPFNMREPTNSLLMEMEDLMRLGDEISLNVRKSGIFCFATMIHKVHQNKSYLRTADAELVNRWVQYYFDRVINEPTFEMKMVFLQAMRNIQIGDVHKLLEPMIRGEQMISEKPDHLRFHAMMMNWGVPRDVEYIHNLYLPILSNTSTPLMLRLCAYAILIDQPPRMERLMNLYWLMVYEKNEHMYNFHYTTMKSLANTVDPCMAPMKEMARKLMRFIRARPVSGIMTGSWLADFENREFGFGEAMSMTMAADELTGMPYSGILKYTTMNRRKPVHQMMMYVRMEGVDIQHMMLNTSMERPHLLVAEVKRVLEKAGEDMPKKKPIHIEVVIMIQGHTVFATHLDKMPRAMGLMAMINMVMDMKMNMQYLEFDELYTMQVPNDLGLPSLLHNMMPRVMSIGMNNEATSRTSPLYSMKMEAMLKNWQHGYCSMEVYNPMMDTWHAIRRVLAHDTNLAMSMSMSYNELTGIIKLNFPMLPMTRYSISGGRSYAKNYVMVTGAESGMLEQHCGTCRGAELVTRGPEHRRNTTLMNFDSRDTGLHVSMYKYDCERVTPLKSRSETAAEMVNRDGKNAWDHAGILAAMTARENYLLTVMSPELGNCGHITRLEPSILYPTSEVDVNMRMSLEMPNATIMNVLPAMRMNFRGTLDAKAAATNISVISWTMTVKATTSQGHVNNNLQVQMTRKTPGQTDLQVCVDGYKIYPTQEVDPFVRVPTTKQEIIGKLTMTMGENENVTCVRDDVSVIINMKAEMTSEQREAMRRDLADGLCQKDMKNPIYMYTESSMVPRTLACMREAMAHSAMRKYSYTMFYQNIPENIMSMIHPMADYLRSDIMGRVTYLPAHTEPGIMKMFMEYPLSSDEGMILNLRTPTHEEKYTGIAMNDREEFMRLDNARFSQNFIMNMENNRMKHCVIYPEVLLNGDGAVVPFAVPGQYTLLTGDHMDHMFSVFVKRLEPKKLGMLMTMMNHTIEVTPSATIPTVSLDGNTIDYVTGLAMPLSSSYVLRISWIGNRLVIQSTYPSFDLEWTERSVRLGMMTSLQGRVTGLCGHLDGTHGNGTSTVYSFGS